MIRLSALWLAIGGLAWWSRRDWYISLCGLIVLMAVIEHPDVPKTMFGIQGLNFWNLLLVVVMAGWLSARKREGLTWDLPAGTLVLFGSYVAIVSISFGRMIMDRQYLDESAASLVSEYFVNTFKWLLPGLMLYDGCRSRHRFELGLLSVLTVYVALGLYVIKWMPLETLSNGDALQERALKILVNEIGYHRVTMSMMLAGASWAIYASRRLVPATYRPLTYLAMAALVLAQALTGGRMGYITWMVIAVLFFLVRDRAALALAPVGAAAVLLLVPAAGERLLQGFSPETSVYMQEAMQRGERVDPTKVDVNTVTAGRTLIWPYVEEKILERPLVGYGMLAMRRTGLSTFLSQNLGEGFDHPHNAYLEVLFDNGVIGFLLEIPLFLVILWRSFRLYTDSRSPLFIAAGGSTLALVLALFVAGLGSQSFYPREASVGMWCSIGLMLRIWTERKRADEAVPASTARVHAVPQVPMRWPSAAIPASSRIPELTPPTPEPAHETRPVEERLWRAS